MSREASFLMSFRVVFGRESNLGKQSCISYAEGDLGLNISKSRPTHPVPVVKHSDLLWFLGFGILDTDVKSTNRLRRRRFFRDKPHGLELVFSQFQGREIVGEAV